MFNIRTTLKTGVSSQTRNNWLVDAALLSSAVIAAVSGVYFLFLPDGGFKGGRNPWYNVTILFDRHTWDDLHTWGGLAMIAAALIHLVIHWRWVVNMARRLWQEVTGKSAGVSQNARWNLILNLAVAFNFLLTALSGVYFLLFPGGRGAADPLFLFSRTTWDLIHTWAGVALTGAAVIHFAIHWRWVINVTKKMFRLNGTARVVPQPAQ